MLYFSRLKTTIILGICLLGAILSAPNLFTRDQLAALPSWVPAQQMNLGLDLRGGSYLLLEVDLKGVLKERLETLVESVRAELVGARVRYSNLGVAGERVQVRIREPGDIQAARTALAKIPQPLTSGLLGDSGQRDMTIESTPDGLFTLALNQQGLKEKSDAILQQSIEIVRRRIDQMGLVEPIIQRQGTDRILLQLPGVDDPQRIKEILGKTAKMTFRMVDVSPEAAQGRPPPGSEVLPSDDRSGPPSWVVRKKIEVDGGELETASAALDQRTGQWIVNFRFNSNGGRKFANVTKDNVGKPFAIVLDGKVISAPVIREPILGGSGQISGNFTVQSANDLALLLRAGALPAPLSVIEERSVGPDLGADSIRAGIIAVLIGFVLVVAYMFAAYGLFGLFANIALLFNLLLTIGALSALQATLTLPGIAGLLLTLGMSVDANVLINERIREETRRGKSPLAALEAGFSRAFSTIVDANLTSLIKMAILFALGSGPVRGFAVTISLGIITSMFTATLLVRWMTSEWYRRNRPARLAA